MSMQLGDPNVDGHILAKTSYLCFGLRKTYFVLGIYGYMKVSISTHFKVCYTRLYVVFFFLFLTHSSS